MNNKKSIAEQLAGLGVALENSTPIREMIFEFIQIDRETKWKPISDKFPIKPYYRMKERW